MATFTNTHTVHCRTATLEVFHCIVSLKIVVEPKVLPAMKSLIGHMQHHLRHASELNKDRAHIRKHYACMRKRDIIVQDACSFGRIL